MRIDKKKLTQAIKDTEARRRLVDAEGMDALIGPRTTITIPPRPRLSTAPKTMTIGEFEAAEAAWCEAKKKADAESAATYHTYWHKYREAKASISNERLSRLYAIQAHARGRQHMKRMRICWDQLSTLQGINKGFPVLNTERDEIKDRLLREAQAQIGNGHAIIDLTMEDQAAFIGEAWKEFELPAESAA